MDLYSKMSATMEELTQTFTSRMTQYEEDLRSAGESTHKTTVASLSKDFNDFKGLVWKTMGALKAQLELLLMAVDRHEMASRSKVLLLHGLTEDKRSQPTAQVLNVLSERMNINNVSPTQIVSCHYLGTNLNKPRPLLVRFSSKLLQSEVWQNKTTLKGTGLTLSEFLTKPRHEVFMNARRYYGVKRCWTSEGKIIVQISDKTRRKIETASELRAMMAQFPNTESTQDSTAAGIGSPHQAGNVQSVSSDADKTRPRRAVKLP